MKRFGASVAAVCAVTIGGLCMTIPAAAANGTVSAADTIAQLQAQGHHVQINGPSSGAPLSQCKTTGVHGLRDSNVDSSGAKIDEDLFSTVYVDVVCHNP